LVGAIQRRDVTFLIQMILVQLFVMLFEVMYLYREIIRAVTPWLLEQTGVRLSVTSTLMLAAVGWIGVRVSTWVLVARYGTPPLLAFIARRPLADEDTAGPARAGAHWWRPVVDDFRRDIDWLHEKSVQVLELIALPVLQLLGAALNFAMIVAAGHAAFTV